MCLQGDLELKWVPPRVKATKPGDERQDVSVPHYPRPKCPFSLLFLLFIGPKLTDVLQKLEDTLLQWLLERGYSRKSSDSESSSRFCHVNSRKSLKQSVGRGLNISKRVNPQGSKVLRAVLKQVISIKQMLRINSSDHRGGKLKVNEKGTSNQQVAESDIFSTASSTTVFNSSSEVEAPCATQKDSLFTTHTCYQPLNLHNPIEEVEKL